MSKTSGRGRPPGTARKRGPGGRSPQAAAIRRRRARRLRWIAIGAAGAVLAALIAVRAAAGRTTTASGTGSVTAGPSGAPAPQGSFTTVSGQRRTVSSLRGRAALVWLVATWCPSCQAGTQVMAANLARLRADGVRVVELEDYQDLGQPGPAMASFGPAFAGAAYRSPDWTFGVASRALTRAYNARGYLDIYYLLDASGHITYVDSGPGSTMSQLLAHAGRLT